MEWYWLLLLLFGVMLLLLLTGLPVAFSFFLLNLAGMYFFYGGEPGLRLAIGSIYDSLATFTLLPIPLFVLMGEVLFESGIAPKSMDALDRWIGHVPGRLALEAVAAGTLLGTLTGSGVSSVAILGLTLVPEMEKRGYKKSMAMGPILGSSGIAELIPPSNFAVVVGAIGQISIGKILIAIIIPGLLMGVLYTAYIVGRCILQPDIAPPYKLPPLSLSEKILPTVKYVLPMGIVVFLVVGTIFIGVATPSEAAAAGTLCTFILAAAYKGLNWTVVKKSVVNTLAVSGMVLLIIGSAIGFSQVLAMSGATRGLSQYTVGLPLAPIAIVIATQIVVVILGMFMSATAILMITLPIFVPIIVSLGFDPVWFAAMYVVNMELATISPPFGTSLFAMMGVAPKGTTFKEVALAAIPFCILDVIVLALMIAFPQLSLWLVGLMGK